MIYKENIIKIKKLLTLYTETIYKFIILIFIFQNKILIKIIQNFLILII